MSSVKRKILNAKQYIVFRNKYIIFPSCLFDFVVRCTRGLGRKAWHLQKKPNKVFWLVRIHPFSWLTSFCGNLTCIKSMLVIRWNEAEENKKVTEELRLFRGGSAVMGTFHVKKWSIICWVLKCSLQCVFGKVPFSSLGGRVAKVYFQPTFWLTHGLCQLHSFRFYWMPSWQNKKRRDTSWINISNVDKGYRTSFFWIYKTAYYIEIWFQLLLNKHKQFYWLF